MTRQLFIAEKPSLAKEIAQALAEKNGVKAEKSGSAWHVGEDKVGWLFGHMYRQLKPQEYDPKYSSWNIQDLPIVPKMWKLAISGDKGAHIKGIQKLLKEAKSVVNAGDAAREGQLLVDEVLVEAGWDPFKENTKRLWVKSMARKDMLAALDSMGPNREKQALYHAALCRQRADWLHGMNLTVLYTVKAQQQGADQLVTVGRVQTPTLRLIVDRDLEIKNFKPVNHFLPSGVFVHENGKFTANWIIPDDSQGLDAEGRLVDETVAKDVLSRISGKPGTITDYKAQEKKKAPPLPYSLSALQTECSAKLGLSAQQTLDVAQKLYETHKVATYPRSDSRYLSDAIYQDEAPAIMENLKKLSDKIGDAAKGSDIKLKGDAWNDKKVSDHHAIIPTVEATQSKVSALSGIERQVFDLICKSFISLFYPNQRWKSLSAVVKVGEDSFKATGRREIDAGWRAVYTGEQSDPDDDVEEDGQSIPEMSKGDAITVEKGTVQAKRTTPPSHFTDGTLIAAMSNIHRFVQDAESKKKLKENAGIGTEATRAPTIETMIKRGFIKRKGKNQLISTDTGRSIIQALPDDVTSPVLTAIWETNLELVNTGELTLDQFMAIQLEDLDRRIEVGKNANVKIDGAKKIIAIEGHGTSCKKCSNGMMITREIRKGDHKGKKFLSCNQYPSCDAVQWPEEKIDPVEGHGTPCPKCKVGKMLTRVVRKGEHKGKKFLSCDQYRVTKCDASIWPRPTYKPIAGHGKPCPKCGDGKMETMKSKKGTYFLGCTGYPTCDSVEFQKDKPVAKISGDGNKCTKCGTGKMVTRKVMSGGNKGKSFLSCDAYPSCKNAIWP